MTDIAFDRALVSSPVLMMATVIVSLAKVTAINAVSGIRAVVVTSETNAVARGATMIAVFLRVYVDCISLARRVLRIVTTAVAVMLATGAARRLTANRESQLDIDTGTNLLVAAVLPVMSVQRSHAVALPHLAVARRPDEKIVIARTDTVIATNHGVALGARVDSAATPALGVMWLATSVMTVVIVEHGTRIGLPNAQNASAVTALRTRTNQRANGTVVGLVTLTILRPSEAVTRPRIRRRRRASE